MVGLTGQEGERGPNNTFSFFLLILFCFVLRTLRSFSFNGKYMSVFQDGANPTTVTSAYLFNTELGIKSTKSFRVRLRSHGSPMSRDKKKTTTSRWFTLWFVCNPEKPSSQVLRSPEQVVFVSSVCVCVPLFFISTQCRGTLGGFVQSLVSFTVNRLLASAIIHNYRGWGSTSKKQPSRAASQNSQWCFLSETTE